MNKNKFNAGDIVVSMTGRKWEIIRPKPGPCRYEVKLVEDSTVSVGLSSFKFDVGFLDIFSEDDLTLLKAAPRKTTKPVSNDYTKWAVEIRYVADGEFYTWHTFSSRRAAREEAREVRAENKGHENTKVRIVKVVSSETRSVVR